MKCACERKRGKGVARVMGARVIKIVREGCDVDIRGVVELFPEPCFIKQSPFVIA